MAASPRTELLPAVAAQILAVRDPSVRAKIYEFKDSLAEGFRP